MDNIIISEFKKELKALLKKYNADIYTELDGDTHGVTDSIVIDMGNKEVMRFENPSEINHYNIET